MATIVPHVSASLPVCSGWPPSVSSGLPDARKGWCCAPNEPGCNREYAPTSGPYLGHHSDTACCETCRGGACSVTAFAACACAQLLCALADISALAWCTEDCAPLRLDARLVPVLEDRSGNGNQITRHGHVTVGADGAALTGPGDYLTVSNFQYAQDATFSIGIWFQKGSCNATQPFEYLYSHNAYLTTAIDNTANSNVNIMLACEGSGGGWSTSAGGSNVRFNLVDSGGDFARFDMPLHEPGNDMRITSLWMHVLLTVDNAAHGRALAYLDGLAVPSSAFGFYRYADDRENMNNLAHPDPGRLGRMMQPFSLREDIHLGTRSDLNTHRFFHGHLAGLTVAETALTSQQVACMFRQGDTFLPAVLVQCTHIQAAAVNVTLIGSRAFMDTSGSSRSVQQHGRMSASAQGAHFDGHDDYVTIATFPYAADKTFSVSLWMAKTTIARGNYEYLYAHQNTADTSTWEGHSYVLIMFAAEANGGGGSSAAGSVIRYEIQDELANRAIFDYSLHRAGDFDTITGVWLHVVLTVTSTSLKTYADGQMVRDVDYGHFMSISASQNAANPSPSSLSPALSGQLDLRQDIFIGSRADRHPQRFFRGRLALVNVYNRALSAMEAQCLFYAGEAALPTAPSSGMELATPGE
jgi:hypothetical protein